MIDQDCYNCEKIDNLKWEINSLEKNIRALEKQLDQSQKESSDFYAVKRERDELKKNQDRSYDSYITDPMRGCRCDDCDGIHELQDQIEEYENKWWFKVCKKVFG